MSHTRNPFLIDSMLVEMSTASITKISRMCLLDADDWMRFALSVAINRAYQFGLRKAGRTGEIAGQLHQAFSTKYFNGENEERDSRGGWLRVHLDLTMDSAYKLGIAHMLAGQIKKADTGDRLEYVVDMIEDLIADGNQWICDQMIRACTWQDLSLEMQSAILNATELIKDYLPSRNLLYVAIADRKLLQ